ncbi:MAG TPA: hypothetical protein VIY56_00220 [Vicinamibacterales bacterium]
MHYRLKLGTTLAGATIAAAATVGSAGAATNLISNGAFDTNTAGWTLSGAEGTFTRPHIGHGALMTNTQDGFPASETAANQCVNVVSGSQLSLFARSMIPADQEAEGSARYYARFYEGTGCSGDFAGGKGFGSSSVVGSWQTTSKEFVIDSGPGIRSMQLQLVAKKDSGSDGKPFRVRFDDITLTLLSSPPDAGGGVTCVAFGGGCEEDDKPVEPAGPVICVTCKNDPEPPAPETPEGPTLEPLAPAEPADAPSDEPSAPVQDSAGDIPVPGADEPASSGQPSSGHTGKELDEPIAGEPSGNGGNQPSNGNGQPTSQGNGGPAMQPTLQPAPGDTTLDHATPTPIAPATGGDSTNDPAAGVTGAPAQASPARSDAGIPMPVLVGAALTLLLAALALGLGLKRVFRR